MKNLSEYINEAVWDEYSSYIEKYWEKDITKCPENISNVKINKENMFSEMFSGCKNLKEAPELPQSQLTEQCYSCMFDRCKSLKYGPSILPAKHVCKGSYAFMFSDCSSLIEAPEIDAESLEKGVYVCNV